MKITRIRGATPEQVANGIRNSFTKLGYKANISVDGVAVQVQNVRLSDEWVEKYGRNVNSWSGRRGRYLGWENWVQVNNTINRVMDRLHASGNAQSLGGKFKIREGNRKFTRDDWDDLAYENIGSMVNPVYRKDQYLPENPSKVRKHLEEVV